MKIFNCDGCDRRFVISDEDCFGTMVITPLEYGEKEEEEEDGENSMVIDQYSHLCLDCQQKEEDNE